MATIQKIVIIACILCSLPLHLFGQAGKEQIRFNHITDKDGLSQSTVETILQDSYGYMWFGTHSGLNKFNGYDFVVYKFDPHDSTSISYNEISSIVEDENGNLWIATVRGGLNRYNRETDNFTRFDADPVKPAQNRLLANTLYTLELDNDGGLWIGTTLGFSRMDLETEELTHFTSDSNNPASLSNNSVRSVLTDTNGLIWVGTNDGLSIYDPSQNVFIQYQNKPELQNLLSGRLVQTLFEDSKGNIWIGTMHAGVYYYNRNQDRLINYRYDSRNPYSISDNSVTYIFEDSYGALWFGTENQGLNLFDWENELFFRYQHDPSDPSHLNNNAIYSIYESSGNIMWVGTYNGGLNITNRKPSMFEHYNHDANIPSSLSTNSVFSFLEDTDGNFWVGTDGGGLNHFDRQTGTFNAFKHNPDNLNSLSSNVIFDIEQDTNGNLWLGTYRGGITKFDPETGTFSRFVHEPDNSNSLNNNEVFALKFDEENPDLLWIGTNGGGINLLNIETETFTHYTITDTMHGGLSNNYIREFLEDNNGTFWIGSYGEEIVSFNKETESFHSDNISHHEFRSNAVQSIYEDSQNRFWLGSRGGGLILFDRETHNITPYTETHGLTSNNVYGILEDDHGYLWLSTDDGLSRFSPELENFNTYGVEHGLQSWEFNQRAFYKDSEGYMYFGGINGFNRFHPDNIRLNTEVAPVVFTDFQIFNQSVPIAEDSPLTRHISQTDKITLPFDASVLTFSYAALNYDFHKGYQFAYKMEGFDDEWRYVNDRRMATYTNLNPGEYTFRVKAANSDGIWGEEEATVSIIITPPFWATTWFYLFSGLFIAGLIWGGYQYRVRNISLHNRQLAEEVEAQTHQLSEQNKELSKTLQELHQTKEQLVAKAHKAGMADVATGVLHNVGNILNSVNVSAAEMESIIKNSQFQNIRKANALLKENRENIDAFIQTDPKGKKLLDYYLLLEQPIADEQQKLLLQNQRLVEKINLIIDVVSAQQSISIAGRIVESLSLNQLIDNTITLHDTSFQRHNIVIKKNYQDIQNVTIEKNKFIHILINLIKNAKESINEFNPDQKIILISTWQDDNNLYVSVSDTGKGIERAHLTKVFTHGFTTKASGHGYGLHTCANYVREMGGMIKAESDGHGSGAEFILSFPKTPHANGTTAHKNKTEVEYGSVNS